MPVFRYVTKNWEGETGSGTLAAPTLRDALEQLRAQELFVISIREQGAVAARREITLQGIVEKMRQKKPKSRDFMIFCRQFATMLQAGITVLQILKILAQQSENATMRERLRDVSLDVERGSDLAGAMRKHGDYFPQIMVSMVGAAEAGGILDNVMERLATHFQNQHDLEEKIRSATTYPIVISCLTVAVMALMVFFVLPRFAAIFGDMGFELPLLTRALLGLAGFVTGAWYIFIPLVIILVLALRSYLRTPAGREMLDRVQLRLPIYGKIYNTMIVARFARTLSTLLASGVSLIPSLELSEKVVNNVTLVSALTEARRVIRQGQSLALPLAASGLFPPMLVEMVHIGEESGALDSMLARTADFYEGELTFVLDRLGAIIEPAMIIVIGIFVGLLMISIIQPMFGIYQII